MGVKKELKGMKFGRLTVLEETGGRNKDGKVLWKCQCECGNIKTNSGSNLISGAIKSCGCLRTEIVRENSIKHGMWRTPTYQTWENMLKRCNNKKNKAYKDYGGRGIKVCERWLNFINFFKDMGIRPEGLTIERKNNELGYFKENCCWATQAQQNRNKRPRQNWRIGKDNKTGTVGVRCYKNKNHTMYRASIGVNKKKIHLGCFNDINLAILARKKAEAKYWLSST